MLCLSKKIKNKKNYKIKVICGPLAASKKSLFDIKDVNNNIEVISNNFNIPKILQNTDLYIGVSSSIIYELVI